MSDRPDIPAVEKREAEETEEEETTDTQPMSQTNQTAEEDISTSHDSLRDQQTQQSEERDSESKEVEREETETERTREEQSNEFNMEGGIQVQTRTTVASSQSIDHSRDGIEGGSAQLVSSTDSKKRPIPTGKNNKSGSTGKSSYWKAFCKRLLCIPFSKVSPTGYSSDRPSDRPFMDDDSAVSEVDSDAELEEERQKQAAILAQLGTSLFIFSSYIQQLGLLLPKDDSLAVPPLWDRYFGWVNNLALNIDLQKIFSIFSTEEDDLRAGIAWLLAAYCLPLFLLLLFTQSLDHDGTNLKTSYGEKVFYFNAILLLVGGILVVISVLIGAFISWVDAVFSFILAAYVLLSGSYYFLKFYYIEKVLVPQSKAQGVHDFIPRISMNRTEVFLLQLMWNIAFTPVASVWAQVAVLSSNIYLSAIGGTLGVLLLIYMVMLFVCLANAALDYSERNTFISGFTQRFILIGFARNKDINKAYVARITEPFRKTIWWFQSLFLIEKLLLACSENFFELETLEAMATADEISTGASGNYTRVELANSYLSLAVAVLFALVIYALLPYATSYDNRIDTVSRVSNILILALALANSFQSSFESSVDFELIISGIMVALSILMFFFWVYVFNPVILAKTMVQKMKRFLAWLKWRNLKSYSQVKALVLSRDDQKVKKQEWNALTSNQRFLTMCVERKLTLFPTAKKVTVDRDLEKHETDLRVLKQRKDLDVTEFGFSMDYKLSAIDRCVLRRRGFMAFTHLKLLDLENSYCTVEAMKALSESKILNHVKKLKYLKLTHCQLRNEGVKHLISALNTNTNRNVSFNLVNLRLDYCKLTNQGGFYIAEYLKDNLTLKKLVLHANYIGNTGASAIFDSLKQNNTLFVLDFQKNNLQNEAGKAAGEALMINKGLKKLVLLYNYLTVIGVEYLTKALESNETLEVLSVEEQTPPEVLDDFWRVGVPASAEELNEEAIVDFDDEFPPSTNVWCQNKLAYCLHSNRTVHFIGADEFLNDCRKPTKHLFICKPKEDEDEDEDDCSSVDFEDKYDFSDFEDDEGEVTVEKVAAARAVEEAEIIGFSEDAWEYVESGLCCMLSSGISYLSPTCQKRLRKFVNTPRADGENEKQTMLELVLKKGVSHVVAAVKVLHDNGADWNMLDSTGVPLKQVALSHWDPAVRQWTTLVLGCFAEKYEILERSPLYETSSCKIIEARNVYTDEQFVIKVLKNPNVLLREIKIRNLLRKKTGYETYVVDDIWNSTWKKEYWESHNAPELMLEDKEAETKTTKESHLKGSQRPEQSARDVNILCLVMPRCDSDLERVMSLEDFSGKDFLLALHIAFCAAKALQFFATNGIVHGDFKPRNFVRVNHYNKTCYKLVDFDSSVAFGESVGVKCSSAYAPPELAKFLFTSYSFQPTATEKYDVWSYGCVLHELFCGRPLFAQQLPPHDDLALESDKSNLVNWKTLQAFQQQQRVSSVELVLQNVDAIELSPDSLSSLGFDTLSVLKAEAYDLIARCLEGDIKSRPNFEEILTHPLFRKLSESEQ